MQKIDVAHKLMRDLIDQTEWADIHDSRKAFMLALLAERCAEDRDWLFFDEICQKSSSYDGGIELTPKLADVAFDALKAQKDGGQVFLRIVEKATDAGIQKVDGDLRVMIDYSLKLMGNAQMANRWRVNLSSDIFSDLLKAESLIGEGKLQSIDKAIEILQQLKPKAFSDGEQDYSQKDAERLILNDLLGAFVAKADIGGVAETLRRIEDLKDDADNKMSFNAANLGSAYIMLGETKKGVAMLSDALSSLKNDPTGTLAGYLMLGKGYNALDDVDRALWSVTKARDLAKSQGSKFFYVRASVALVLIAVAQAKTEVPCSEILDEVIPIAESESFVDDLANAYLARMVLVMENKNILRQKKLEQLKEIQQKALNSARAPLIMSSIFAISANLKHANNFPAEVVLSDIEQYFNYSRLYLGRVSKDSASFNIEESMKVRLFEILVELGDSEKIDYWNKVFERRKTRDVTMAATASQGDESFLSMMEQISKYEAASEILKREQARPEGSRDQTLLAKATEIKRELERNFDEAQKTLSPENAKRLRDLLADSFIIHPDSMGQLCSVLSDDVVCLQFLTVGEKIVVYLAAKGATPFVTTVQLKEKGLTERQLSSKVVKLRSKIQNGAAGKSLDQDLKALYDVLIADVRPVMDRLKCRRVIVNSSGVLRYVPFAALYDGDKYLVERYQISNVTGLDLIRLAKAEPNRSADSVRAMVFADPDGSLPSGRKEGERVAELFKNSQLLVGDKASMANFESMIGNVNFIHLATHAVLDSGNPKNSFILFADGCQWRYCDMMGFCVENVDSIVLSACSTAVGEKSDGGEIEGMAYQLLRKSPSGSVLASFWKVDDEATEKLMGVYYNHISSAMREKGSLDRGGALHEAQLALLHDPDTASPYYWAAFSLFGDFR